MRKHGDMPERKGVAGGFAAAGGTKKDKNIDVAVPPKGHIFGMLCRKQYSADFFNKLQKGASLLF